MKRKTHSAVFNNDDLSVALVFRRVKENNVDVFEDKTGLWVFNESSLGAKCLAKHKKEFDDVQASARLPLQRLALQAISKKLISFLEQKLH